MTKVIQTPDHCFANLPGYGYAPNYVDVDDTRYGTLRMHYVDEGPKHAPVVLMLHGEPSWSYAWRGVIDAVVKAGCRAIAPDHIGFGRSDKLTLRADYSYADYINWMTQFITALDLQRVTLVCQDWGGPIGLSALARLPHRFDAVVAANTLLPNNEPPPSGVANWPGQLILDWVEQCANMKDMPVSAIVGGVCVNQPGADVLAAYDAPFPQPAFKAAALAFPGLIPVTDEQVGTAENRAVWRSLEQWDKPFVTAFSDSDPSTAAWADIFRSRIPGARNSLHQTVRSAGHFVQEEQPAALAAVVLATLESTLL